MRIRRQQSNINATIGRLSSILPALLEMKKLEAKMKLGKYYSALKIIQLIRHEHLENCRQVNLRGVLKRGLFQMVEHKRKKYRLFYLDNAIFQPSKTKLVQIVPLS